MENLDQLVRTALTEDVGSGDITSSLTIDQSSRSTAVVKAKQSGVISGLSCIKEVFKQVDSAVELIFHKDDGDSCSSGEQVFTAKGSARSLLTAERTALNFLQHLSGIATLTAECVSVANGTDVRILDTRKTTPGLRDLEKQAVADGGGVNHRQGLYDAVLIKENHIAAAGSITAAVAACSSKKGDLLIEVECSSKDEVVEALGTEADRLLLDNMTPQQIKQCVELTAGKLELEASGGIDLTNLSDYVQTGVNYVSLGFLTHSAPALDLSMTLTDS